ncbi:hypothetical protein QYF36_001400 [Acer negundo]|nr:hypothetical protein QYF36_001400 [Acer negundo]
MGGKYKSVLGFVGMMMMLRSVASSSISHDYGDALSKCILFFEGQRSGKLPSSQRMTWRKDSALHDGSDIGIDLVGGYYDAGDNIKFNFPMAFTTTMLAWSILEFGNHMGSELQHATEAVKWGTDYFLKATSVPGKVVAQVGEPYGDHNCWERPEDMDTARTSYVVNTTSPGSEVSAEIAAALAASSMVFKNIDNRYSQMLLKRASQVFQFADQHRGSYNESIGPAVCPFYCDFSGFMDDLIWGAAWLYKATNTKYYLKYVLENIHYLQYVPQSNDPIYIGGSFEEFGWDSKHAGISVLLSGLLMNTRNSSNTFVQYADKFVCSVLPESHSKNVYFSPGGLLFKDGGSNTQHTTAISFLLLVYSRYFISSQNRAIQCENNVVVTPSRLVQFAKGQVGGYYDAGDNITFSFPLAFTTTMIALSILEFGNHTGSELQHATEAVKWGTYYFLKATTVPGKVVAQVGEPYGDHNCWERPEDMDTARTSYLLNTTNPGSEVSAEIAAALTASSMVFKNIDNRYSQVLFKRASQVESG